MTKRILAFIPLLLSCYFLSGQTKKTVDSLKKIVALKYKWGEGPGSEKTQLRYINACTLLGDYYVKTSNPAAAALYYKKVADLTDGTDSDLAEHMAAVKARDLVRIRYTELVLEKPSVEKDKNRILYYVESNPELPVRLVSRVSDYLYGKNILFLKRPGRFVSLKDSAQLEYIINPLYNNFLSLRDLTALANLEMIAEYLRSNPEKKLVILSIPNSASMRNQYRSSMLTSSIINELTDLHGISPDRLMPQTEFSGGDEYNSVSAWVLRLILQ